MTDTTGFTLRCPIRGRLKVSGKSKDGLTPTEEKYRVEALQHLVEVGYPKLNFVVEPVIKRFGNSGRNSFRADFAVLDTPRNGSVSEDWVLEHALVLGEIKRDNADAQSATSYQVKPLLDFARKPECVAVYWDNVEQKVFWQELRAGVRKTVEGPIEVLPKFGQKPGTKRLELGDLRADPPLREVFQRIEDELHAGSISPSKRFQIMLQLLLAKIYDETSARNAGTTPVFQDYRSLDVDVRIAKSEFRELLKEAVSYYQQHLPERVSTKFEVNDEAFTEIVSLLAPYRITAASHAVVQEFYMYFGKGLYKWDLAQYFTPPTVTDFVISIASPEWNQRVLDPACGSADFLTSAFRRGVDAGFQNYADMMWGYDVSTEAVQVGVLNMVLNGDGKSNIKHKNSLNAVDTEDGTWDLLICNPPFGTRIVERDADILRRYVLGSKGLDPSADAKSRVALPSQETGLLFLELCIRLAKPGTGRIAIVVPNGYLGNVSPKYIAARELILRETRVAAIVALPRFTFKKSGADVSASIMFLEKRESPLADLRSIDHYEMSVNVVDNVGWRTSDKRGSTLYVRDLEDGTLVLDDKQDPIVLADFEQVLDGIRDSAAAQDFEWLARMPGTTNVPNGSGHSVGVDEVVNDKHLTLDPKRRAGKYRSTVEGVISIDHFTLSDIVDVLPEMTAADGSSVEIEKRREYNYVELQSVESGAFRSERMRGWELPSRARHVTEPGDIYVGAVWGSVRKWFVVGDSNADVIATNGMHRLRLKPGMEECRADLIAGLSSESYAVQMRALARGSDGLAEIRADELRNIVIPRVTDSSARETLQKLVDQLFAGMSGVESAVQILTDAGKIPGPKTAPRTSHVQLV